MADQRAQYTEEAIGAGHPTKADTINRLALIGHNTDGSHKFWIDPVEVYGSITSANIASAIASLPSTGGTIVFRGACVLSTAITVNKSNVTFLGLPGSKVTASADIVAFDYSTTDNIENITFEGMNFEGGTVDSGSYPRRSRTNNTGISCAIQLRGDLSGAVSLTNTITNVAVRNCTFKNIAASLPVLLDGIRGKAEITGSHFYNTLDCGWIYCERAICTDNVSTKSADNGFSISRGNTNVVCTGNQVDLCAYSGIYIAGFNVTPGPKYFECVGNIITEPGRMGIELTMGPQFGVVSGNTIRKAYRGPTDDRNDSYGAGILVNPYPTSGTITTYAKGLNITGNMIHECERAGIQARGIQYSSISDNLITDTGSQYLVDGVTSATDNYGITFPSTYGSTISYCEVKNNTIADTRGTPYMYFYIYANAPTYCNFTDNKGFGITDSTRKYITAGYVADTGLTNNFEARTAHELKTTDSGFFFIDTAGYARVGWVKLTGDSPGIGFGSSANVEFKKATTAGIDDVTATYTTYAQLESAGDFKLTQANKGLIVRKPDNSGYIRIRVDNAGAIVTETA